MTKLEEAMISLGLDTSDLEAQRAYTTQELQRMGETWGNELANSFNQAYVNKLREKGLTSKGGVLNPALTMNEMMMGGAAAAGAIFGIEKIGQMAQQILTLAKNSGFAAQDYEALMFQVSNSQGSVEAMNNALYFLNKTIGEARVGVPEAQEKFERWGISITDTGNAAKDTEQIYEDLLDRIQGLSDPSERAAIKFELLGRGAKNVGDALNQGSKTFEDVKTKLKAITPTDDELRAWAELGREIKTVGEIIADISVTAGGFFLSKMTPVGISAQLRHETELLSQTAAGGAELDPEVTARVKNTAAEKDPVAQLKQQHDAKEAINQVEKKLNDHLTERRDILKKIGDDLREMARLGREETLFQQRELNAMQREDLRGIPDLQSAAGGGFLHQMARQYGPLLEQFGRQQSQDFIRQQYGMALDFEKFNTATGGSYADWLKTSQGTGERSYLQKLREPLEAMGVLSPQSTLEAIQNHAKTTAEKMSDLKTDIDGLVVKFKSN
jgi:hypothetical protein